MAFSKPFILDLKAGQSTLSSTSLSRVTLNPTDTIPRRLGSISWRRNHKSQKTFSKLTTIYQANYLLQ